MYLLCANIFLHCTYLKKKITYLLPLNLTKAEKPAPNLYRVPPFFFFFWMQVHTS